ncbi:hypothetical protein ABL78_8185 [Leptomonas seymouri]|uniref:Uncharacterized protein n=1 Tax=Leptomonas seymouri TaxID=5684 RepID=A0A0N1PBX0_LEPSE|nr:hypothetical protein ABL78_8185 [Leptomonas seymouri]|eukprot:KPI82804.1 hypothetical protein ABL78_8185 [Leptomonas seymouri]
MDLVRLDVDVLAHHEVLLGELQPIIRGLSECVAAVKGVSEKGSGLISFLMEVRSSGERRLADVVKEVADVRIAFEQAEVLKDAALRQQQQEARLHENEVNHFKTMLQKQAADEAELIADHERSIRRLKSAAAEELTSVEERLGRVVRAHKEEEVARLEAEGVISGLRSALAGVEADLALQQHRASEAATTQRESSARKIGVLETELTAAREQNAQLVEQLARAVHEGKKGSVALLGMEEQLRVARSELAEVRATLATTQSAIQGGAEKMGPLSAADMLARHLLYVKELQGLTDARKAAERQRRAYGVQSDDRVAETLSAFESVWAAAVQAKATPSKVKVEWLTPSDKAEILQLLVKRDFTPQLNDLAAARRLLLDYMSRPTLRRFVRAAAAATPGAMATPLDTAPTATLLQLYNSALHEAHDVHTADLEREIREGRRELEVAEQSLREMEAEHHQDVVEAEHNIGYMREMVQSKLMADELTEAAMEVHLSELHAYAEERADMMSHVQELRRLVRKTLRGPEQRA